MNLTNRQKVGACFAGASVLALVIDRVFLGPDEAGAAPAAPATATAPGVPAATPRTGPSPIPTVTIPDSTLATQLESLASDHDLDPLAVRDVFKVPPGWLPDEGPVENPGRGETADAKAAAQAFSRTHQLSAVMAHGHAGYAVINGKSLRIGQTLDGFRLISVGERSAVLTSNGAEVELTLPDLNSGGDGE